MANQIAKEQWALADDSGLSVDALGGAPGVHLAHYAPKDAARFERLLQELDAAGGHDPTFPSARCSGSRGPQRPSGAGGGRALPTTNPDGKPR